MSAIEDEARLIEEATRQYVDLKVAANLFRNESGEILSEVLLPKFEVFRKSLWLGSVKHDGFASLQRARLALICAIYKDTFNTIQLRMEEPLEDFIALHNNKKNKRQARLINKKPHYFDTALASIENSFIQIKKIIPSTDNSQLEGLWNGITTNLNEELQRAKNLEAELSEKLSKLNEEVGKAKNLTYTILSFAAAAIAAACAVVTLVVGDNKAPANHASAAEVSNEISDAQRTPQ